MDYIFLSHQDPDIGSGLNLWLPICNAKIMISALWQRFNSAFCVRGLSEERIFAIPDQGVRFKLNDSPLIAIAAHFLHSPGNFHLYDPVAKTVGGGRKTAVDDFAENLFQLPGEDVVKII